MASRSRVKATASTFPIPQSRQEASDAVAAIGRAQRELTRIQAAMNDELAAVKERYEEQATPFRDEIQSRTAGVQVWCEANRAQLTDGNKTKTAILPAGIVKWRLTPPAVKVKKALMASVLAALRAAGLGERFIRTAEELNKEAVLADPDAVKSIVGIEIVQAEEFVIEPHADELAPAAA